MYNDDTNGLETITEKDQSNDAWYDTTNGKSRQKEEKITMKGEQADRMLTLFCLSNRSS